MASILPGFYTEPLAYDEAAAYVAAHHRHNDPPQGHVFSVGCYVDGVLVGVAMCGRPVSKHLDNGQTLEVYRVCTQGHRNACSKLYAACQRTARSRGYQQLITYTLLSETAASVRAANFTLAAAKAGAKRWTGRRQPGRKSGRRFQELKRRWVFELKPSQASQDALAAARAELVPYFDYVVYPAAAYVQHAGLPLPAYQPAALGNVPHPTEQQHQDLHELAHIAHAAGFVLTLARHNPSFPFRLTTVRYGQTQRQALQWCDTDFLSAADRLKIYFGIMPSGY